MSAGPGTVIRRARPEDASALRQIVEAAYAPYLAKGIELPPVAEGLDRDIACHIVLVAASGDRLAGGAVLTGDGATQKLANLAVDPNYAGQGIGRALVAAVCDLARSRGARHVDLTTHQSMRATQNFYRGLGWQETGRTGPKVHMEYEIPQAEPKS